MPIFDDLLRTLCVNDVQSETFYLSRVNRECGKCRLAVKLCVTVIEQYTDRMRSWIVVSLWQCRFSPGLRFPVHYTTNHPIEPIISKLMLGSSFNIYLSLSTIHGCSKMQWPTTNRPFDHHDSARPTMHYYLISMIDTRALRPVAKVRMSVK
jgi:hypothetical protein